MALRSEQTQRTNIRTQMTISGQQKALIESWVTCQANFCAIFMIFTRQSMPKNVRVLQWEDKRNSIQIHPNIYKSIQFCLTKIFSAMVWWINCFTKICFNRCWKFQFSILKNKKVLFLQKKVFWPLSKSKQKSCVYWINFPVMFWL